MKQCKTELIAGAIFLCITFPIFLVARGERSAWVLITCSWPSSQAGVGLFGFNYATGNNPIMAENIYYIFHTLMFGGSKQHISLYFTAIRPLCGFLASLFAPFIGVLRSLALLNYISWIIAGYSAWRFTVRLSQDKLAACIAVIFVACGLGFTIHIGDLSHHLLSFTIYFVGVILIYESEVWMKTCKLRTHVVIGCFLALASLAYSVGLMLTLAYLLVSFRRNRLRHIAMAGAIGASAQYIWAMDLNLHNSVLAGKWAWLNVQGVEQDYLINSIKNWVEVAKHPTDLISNLGTGVMQFLCFESALIVVLGLIAWWTVLKGAALRIYFGIFFVVPIACAMLYAQYAGARGYLVYGISILIYCPLAIWFARIFRSAGTYRWLSVIGICAVHVLHFGWSNAYLWGYLFPVKLFMGFGNYLREYFPKYLMEWKMPLALSLTGREATPIMFGGKKSLVDAGLYVAPEPGPLTFSMIFGFTIRALIVLYICMLIFSIAAPYKKKVVSTLVVIFFFWIFPVVGAEYSSERAPSLLPTMSSIQLTPGEHYRYTIDISRQFSDKMEGVASDKTPVQFMLPVDVSGKMQVALRAGGVAILGDDCVNARVCTAKIGAMEIVSHLKELAKIEMDINVIKEGEGPYDSPPLYGWQRNLLAGRVFWNESKNSRWIGDTAPDFELRVLDEKGKILLVGF